MGHKLKDTMHCADCFKKSAKKMWDYYESPEYLERERENAIAMRSFQMQLMHSFEHKDRKRADCEFCVDEQDNASNT